MSATIRSTTIQATVVYDLEKPHLLGATHTIDRVVVEYVSDSGEPDDPYTDITLKGWRLTSKMTVDRRQKDRENVYLPLKDRVELVRDDLHIDYEADLRELLGNAGR